MKNCNRKIYYALGFISGAFVLCGFSTIQKLIAGFPLDSKAYIVPFFYGGITGYIISIILCKLKDEIAIQSNIFQQYLETESNFKNLFNNLTDSVLVFPYDNETFGKIIEANDVACKKFGYTKEEFCKKSIFDITKNKKLNQNHFNIVNDEKNVFEIVFFQNNENSFIGEVNASVIKIKKKNHIIAVIRDNTTKIREQQRYNNLLKNLPDMVYKMSIADGRYLYINEACEKVFGYSSEDFYSNPFIIKDIMHPEYLSYFTEEWNKILNGNPSDTYLYKIIDQEGQEKWIRQKNNFDYNDSGKIIAIEGVVSDVTIEKKAELALKESEEKLSRLLENMKLIAVNLDKNGNILFCNEFLLELTGWKREEIINNNWFDLFIPEEIKLKMQKGIFQSTLQSGKTPTYYENPIVKKDGTKVDILWNNIVYFDKYSKVEFITSIGQDITERNRILDKIKSSEEKFKSYTENAPIGIFVTDETGRYIDVNKKSSELTGYSFKELLSLSIKDIIYQDDLERGFTHFQALQKNGSAYDEIYLLKKDGEKFLGGVNAVKINDNRFLAFVDDLTEIKKAQEEREQLEHQLHWSQRLETIGTLVGGISHDFNNLLTPILGYSELILRHMDKNNSDYENILEILHAANHAKELINQMLNFSRNTKNDKRPVYIQVLLKEAIKMLRPMLPSSIEIKANIDEDFVKILADETKLHQVFVNLINNASQAMENEGGVLSINLEKVTITSDDIIYYSDIDVGDYLKINITDTGIGMDDTVMERIFDPFYTTKDVGKGTGLGLSVAHGIIKDHNGEIQVTSKTGVGSEFSIYLPIIAPSNPEKKSTEILIQGNMDNILILDDEASVARTISKMLKILDFNGMTVFDPEEAFELYKANQDNIKLIITDLTMPKINGLKFIEKIRDINSECPIFLMTGYGQKVTSEIQKKLNISSFLTKPIALNNLADNLNKVFK